jgi:hypothetical protein
MKRASKRNISVRTLLVAAVLVFLLVAPAARAASHFVRAGATGSGTGVDWTNALTDLPTSLVRGDLYYVAAGTYGQHTFNDADSGTTIIEIRAATTADHGTSTGWSDTFQGEALFRIASGSGTADGCVWEFTKDYYLINGNSVRSSDWQSGYLIRISDSNRLGPECTVMMGVPSYGTVGAGTYVHDITLDYVNMDGQHTAQDSDAPIGGGVFESRCGSVGHINHSVLHDGNNTLFFVKGKHDSLLSAGTSLCNPSSTGGQFIIENSYWYRNYSSAAQHGAAEECDEGQFCTIRFNRGRDFNGTAIIDTPSGCGRTTCNIDNQIEVYGNWFEAKTTFTNNGLACGLGGFVQMFDVVFSGPVRIYNNTLVNFNTSICANNSLGAAIFIQQTAPTADLKGGLFVQSNLWYNNDSLTAVNTCSTCASLTWDHNSYFNQSVTDLDSNAQITGSNPFVGSSTDNFHLAFATAAGVSLAAPFNTDPDGVTRGVDGVWDRGAFEFDNGKRPPLPPPKVSAVIH